MIRNYLKTAWRNIARNRGYSTLTVLSLATGMAIALLIGLWAYNEYSYDKFLPQYQQVYRVKRNFDNNGEILTFNTTSLKLADALRNNIPEIEYVAECDWMGQHGLVVGDKKLYIRGGHVGGDFLKIFQYPLLYGTAQTVFKDPYSIVLTEATAKALFGNEDPINKKVRLDNKNDLAVTGVLKDIPNNSTLRFNFLVPFSYLEQTNPNVKAARTGGFGNNGYQQFVKLKANTTQEQVALKIKDIQKIKNASKNAMKSDVIIQPMKNWHLYGEYENGKETGGFIQYVKMFSIIGALVLLIACINFINLSTARSEKRAKEVGIRKAIGSLRKNLVVQFLAESFLFSFMAFILAIGLVLLLLPSFNAMINRQVSIPYSNIFFWMIMLGCIFITAIIAGSRPAFYMSSFKPVKVLKGKLHVGRAASLPRKILVVTQFSCSIALIISTIIVYRQIQYTKERPAGYDTNRLMVTNMSADLSRNYEALKNELIQKGIADQVTLSNSPPTEIYWHSDIDKWPGKFADETVEMAIVLVGDDYFKTLGIPISAGRNFDGPSDTTTVIFNEAAIQRLRLKNPVNQDIEWGGSKLTIAGIVKDALMASPFAGAEPTMFMYSKATSGNILYRLSPRIKTQQAITQLTAVFNKYNPAYPYVYEFTDENYAAKFSLEVLIGKLAGIFAGLAIFISCLGLFGLAAFVAEQRTREIGIRKVLGASVPQLWLMLSKNFIALVLISCVVASPVALYFLHNWLQKYEYRITIGPLVFILAGAIAICITLATVSFQAIKAAMANPVKSLRTE